MKNLLVVLFVLSIFSAQASSYVSQEASKGPADVLRPQQSHTVIIERHLPDSLKGKIAPAPDARKLRKNWGKLKKGMTFSEVERLLGGPTKIACSDYDASTTWYYDTREVVFDNVKAVVRSWEK